MIVGHAGPLFDSTVEHQRLVWDASTLSALARDPWSYYWQYVLGRRLTGWQSYAAFGTAWHLLAEQYWLARDHGFDLYDIWSKLPADGLAGLDAGGQRSAAALLRALVWYDRWNAKRPEGLGETIDIEQKFSYTVPDLQSPDLHPYTIAGSVDQVVRREGAVWFVERKTGAQMPTTRSVLKRYNMQLQIYMLHGRLRYGSDFAGLIVDAMQTAVTFCDFNRFDLPVDACAFDPTHTWDTIKWRIEHSCRLARDRAWKAAARTDDPYAPRELSDIYASHPNLWDRLMVAATVPSPVWYPGAS